MTLILLLPVLFLLLFLASNMVFLLLYANFSVQSIHPNLGLSLFLPPFWYASIMIFSILSLILIMWPNHFSALHFSYFDNWHLLEQISDGHPPNSFSIYRVWIWIVFPSQTTHPQGNTGAPVAGCLPFLKNFILNPIKPLLLSLLYGRYYFCCLFCRVGHIL